MAQPPVVLLHGWGGSFASTWAAGGWVEALEARGRAVITLDLPGHGGRASHKPADYADLAGTVQAALPEERVDVIAFSLGSKLALAAASRRPDRFRRMVLGGVGDNVFVPEPRAEMLAAALTEGVDQNAPAPLKHLVHYALASGNEPAALAAVLRRPPNPKLLPADLVQIGEILLVNGSEDHIATPDFKLREALKACVYRSVAGVDHLGLPDSELFCAAALDFLDR